MLSKNKQLLILIIICAGGASGGDEWKPKRSIGIGERTCLENWKENQNSRGITAVPEEQEDGVGVIFVPSDLEGRDTTATYIYVLILSAVGLSATVPLLTLVARGIVLLISGATSNFKSLSDCLALMRATFGFSHALCYGLTANTQFFGLSFESSVFFGGLSHVLSVATMVMNLLEATNMLNVVKYNGDNRWGTKEDFWSLKRIGGVLINAVAAVMLTVSIGLALPDEYYASPWASTGTLSGRFTRAMCAVIVGLGAISSIIHLVAALSYRRSSSIRLSILDRADSDAHRRILTELVRTRWFAPVYSMCLAFHFVLSILSMDIQEKFSSLTTVCFSFLNVVVCLGSGAYSVNLWRTVKEGFQKCLGFARAPKRD